MSTSSGHYSLANCRILVTRAEAQAESTKSAIESRGGTPVLFPVIKVAQRMLKEDTIGSFLPLSAYEWVVFSSANSVDGFAGNFLDSWKALPPESRPQIAVVGARTAKAASLAGLPVDFQPPRATGYALGTTLPLKGNGPVLFPCGNQARPEIPDLLTQRGPELHSLTVYDTTIIEHDPETVQNALAEPLNAILLTSPSTVDGLLTNCRKAGVSLPASATLACIGETTASQLEQWDHSAHLTPDKKGLEPLLDALAANWNSVSQLNS